jgi:serine/threonine protein kinase
MTNYECPYAAGEQFTIILTPPCLTTSVQQPPCVLQLQIIDTRPFTKSQGLKVAVISTSDAHVSVPSTAFLKFYDRRYLDERMGDDAFCPWNHQLESEAEDIARAFGKTSHIDLDDPSTDDISQDSDNTDDEDGEMDSWETEEYYRDLVRGWFRTEVKAYRRLQPLQGICVPRFYGTVTIDSHSLHRMPPGVLTEVRGILLEFIGGECLDEIDKQSSIMRTHKVIGQAAIVCFERIHSLGVLHGDVRVGNLIVRNSDARVFLFDFALATLRGKDEPDQDWAARVERENEVYAMKDFLHRRELRDRTPREPFDEDGMGYGYYNSVIEDAPEAWRLKYYEKIMDKARMETRTNVDGEFDYVFPNWRLKKGPAAAQADFIANSTRSALAIKADE